MQVRIYQPSKTAMQSGRGKSKEWVVEPVLPSRREPEPLMGWVGSKDTLNQVKLKFPTRDEAVAYARRNGYQFTVVNDRERRIKPKSYAANFAYDRVGRWTH